MNKNLFSIEDEPVFNEPVKSEPNEIDDKNNTLFKDTFKDTMYSSVQEEPCYTELKSVSVQDSIRVHGRKISGLTIFFVTFTGSIFGGVFALFGCLFSMNVYSIYSIFDMLNLVFIGPFLEENLKQSCMIFLLENKPWYVQYRWQFYLSAILAALTFASIENIIYGSIYLTTLPPEHLAYVMCFRWTVCTVVHLSCTLISGMGLYQGWIVAQKNDTFFSLQKAFPYFLLAMIIHGVYNFSAFFFF